ncbi:MAG: glutamate racemase [Arcobacter sp.]|nr:glutamate racemase [Arcobacter sp.]
MRVGVFDSGLGGLTVVSSIFELFKGVDIFYIADTFYAPYGLKSSEEVINRSIKITDYLITNHQIQALLIACNTATSAAVEKLRRKYPSLLIIGTEPGLKPALSLSKTNNIGVLATKNTLNGKKYKILQEQLLENKNNKIFENPCIGLVEQIEEGKIQDEKTLTMLKSWLKPMKENEVDTIVLGCTHYPLVSHLIEEIMGDDIQIIQTGKAIANRLKSLSKEKDGNSHNLNLFYTGNINKNMIKTIFRNSKIDKEIIRKCKI